jgi:hypothetical protein
MGALPEVDTNLRVERVRIFLAIKGLDYALALAAFVRFGNAVLDDVSFAGLSALCFPDALSDRHGTAPRAMGMTGERIQ